MKEFLTTLTAMLLMIAAAMWITPSRVKTLVEWILCAAAILWFLPNLIFA